MRTEKELWQIVLSRPDLFMHGLCNWVWNISLKGHITKRERYFLEGVLNKHLPPKNYSWLSTTPSYSFPHNEIKYRIDWINERLKQL